LKCILYNFLFVNSYYCTSCLPIQKELLRHVWSKAGFTSLWADWNDKYDTFCCLCIQSLSLAWRNEKCFKLYFISINPFSCNGSLLWHWWKMKLLQWVVIKHKIWYSHQLAIYHKRIDFDKYKSKPSGF